MAGILETQNQAWSKDTSGFGFQMLQKMGWSEGKGLGKNEDGSLKPVVLRRKLDTTGIGAEKKSSDAWKVGAEVSSSFNNILSNLGSVGEIPKGVEDENRLEVVSKDRLRKKSYFSRLTGGKNVKTYSRNDLKEIFGSSESVFSSASKILSDDSDSKNKEVEPEVTAEKKESKKKSKKKNSKSGSGKKRPQDDLAISKKRKTKSKKNKQLKEE